MILIVEDDPVVRHLLERIAHRLRRPALGVETLADARAALRRDPIDVAVVDLLLPDGDGLDFIASLRTTAHAADVPLAICTTRADVETVHRALELGVSDFVRKPIDIQDVLRRMERLLARAPRRWLGWPELRDRFKSDLRAWRAATTDAQLKLEEAVALDAKHAMFAEAVKAAGAAAAHAGGVRVAALVAGFEKGETDAGALHDGLAIELAALTARAAA